MIATKVYLLFLITKILNSIIIVKVWSFDDIRYNIVDLETLLIFLPYYSLLF